MYPGRYHQFVLMINFEDRLYDYERTEWDKIQSLMNSAEYEAPSKVGMSWLDDFQCARELKPINIHQIWKSRSDLRKIRIICLDYSYREREEIGDGQIGTPSRIVTHKFTTFWFLIDDVFKSPIVKIEPVSAVKFMNRFFSIKDVNTKRRFNKRYIVECEDYVRTNSFLSNELQDLFITHERIWFESTKNKILIRDDCPIEYESFQNKYEFTKKLVRILTTIESN